VNGRFHTVAGRVNDPQAQFAAIALAIEWQCGKDKQRSKFPHKMPPNLTSPIWQSPSGSPPAIGKSSGIHSRIHSFQYHYYSTNRTDRFDFHLEVSRFASALKERRFSRATNASPATAA
jgi:hypothetical protein